MDRSALRLLLLLAIAGCDDTADPTAVDATTDPPDLTARDALDASPARDAEPPPPTDVGPPDADAPDAGAMPRTRHVALGVVPAGAPVTLQIPAEVDAVLLQARGEPGRLYRIIDVRGPDGVLVDETGDAPLRTSTNPEVATALLPNDDDPAHALVPGEYRFRVQAEGPEAGLEAEAWLVSGDGARLQIDLLLPPDTGRAVDDPAVEAMARALVGQLRAAFEVEADVQVLALRADAPAELDVDGRLNGLAELARFAPAEGGGAVDVYLMDQVRVDGDAQGGLTGGLPAPLGMRGTAASVVAVRTPLLDDFPSAVADLVVHEVGHALGLYHTTEPFGDRHDPLADTPECPLACDANGDGVLLARECGARDSGAPPCRGASDNLMFWTLGGLRVSSEGQRGVVHRHPAVAP